ncbi:MAG: hypothetical protein JRN44_03400 [Nitrososphaerota archaeon]|jgi:hypothetical protein|nr:hypothetical protein [Nitrososphaerota archaeon]MDG6946016.1 hypothetical protein [Nitrososphaerota archaeon]MDG6947552.1 hypothetical protein [Nitrososphaerota archaeon]
MGIDAFLRTAWLKGKGIDGNKALSGAGLALKAAVYAFSRSVAAIGLTILLIATILAVRYTVIFIIQALKCVKVPFRLHLFALSDRVQEQRTSISVPSSGP